MNTLEGEAERQLGSDAPEVEETSVEHDEDKDKKKEREDEEVQEKRAAGAHIVYRAVLEEGAEELERRTWALAWSGLAAGLSMGFSLVTEGLLRRHLPDAEWRPLITKFGYSVGFLIVVLGRQQLFTENTLTPILPLLQQRTVRCLLNVTRLWSVVLATNLLGAITFAWVIQRFNVFAPEVCKAFLDIGNEVLVGSFGSVVLRGIFAGWLIALMVWLLPVAETARVSVIIIVTYVVGLGRLSHVIAGSVEAIFTVFAGAHTWGDYVFGFLLPALLGNIIGGVSLVAALNYAQVMAGDNSATQSQ